MLWIYAGLLGSEHGVFEIREGDITPNGLLINAVGPPCQPDSVWHACFPALRIMPNLFTTGLVVILISLIMLIWTVGFIHQKYGGVIRIGLSILLVPFGGGFVPAYVGVVAGAVGSRINARLTWWRPRSPTILNLLSKMWPWTLIILVVCLPGSWITGYLFGHWM